MRGDAVLGLLVRHRDEWIVLDRTLSVLDSGPDLAPLRVRWSARRAIYLHSPR